MSYESQSEPELSSEQDPLIILNPTLPTAEIMSSAAHVGLAQVMGIELSASGEDSEPTEILLPDNIILGEE